MTEPSPERSAEMVVRKLSFSDLPQILSLIHI